jgi:glycosyltransferase involved in cell wall biosynthesis
MITFNDIAVLIYVFNEVDTIREVAEGCLTYCPNLLVVDDGSTDGSIDKIKDLPIVIVHNSMCLGKDQSLIRGFSMLQRNNPKAIITIDGDGADNPDDLPRFIQAMKLKPDHLVLGARMNDKFNARTHRGFGNFMADFFISWAAGQKIIDTQSGFRLIPNNFILEYLKQAPRGRRAVLENEMLIVANRVGYNIVAIPIVAVVEDNAAERKAHPVRSKKAFFGVVLKKLIMSLFNPIGLIKAIFQKKPIIKP